MWVPIAMAAMAAVGSLVSGISQSQQAKGQAGVAKANAEMAEDQAATQASAIRDKARRLSGQNRALIGASGVDISGSFLDALQDSDIESELDAQTAIWNGKLEATNYRAQARAAKAAGSSALVKGIFGAGSSAMSAFGSAYSPSSSATAATSTQIPQAQRAGF